jgi:hypothetical protein
MQAHAPPLAHVPCFLSPPSRPPGRPLTRPPSLLLFPRAGLPERGALAVLLGRRQPGAQPPPQDQVRTSRKAGRGGLLGHTRDRPVALEVWSHASFEPSFPTADRPLVRTPSHTRSLHGHAHGHASSHGGGHHHGPHDGPAAATGRDGSGKPSGRGAPSSDDTNSADSPPRATETRCVGRKRRRASCLSVGCGLGCGGVGGEGRALGAWAQPWGSAVGGEMGGARGGGWHACAADSEHCGVAFLHTAGRRRAPTPPTTATGMGTAAPVTIPMATATAAARRATAPRQELRAVLGRAVHALRGLDPACAEGRGRFSMVRAEA